MTWATILTVAQYLAAGVCGLILLGVLIYSLSAWVYRVGRRD